MSISNLSSQYISQSFQSLVQIDTATGKLYDGLGVQVSSLAVTASLLNSTINQNLQITGSLKVSGSITGSLSGTASYAISSSQAVSSSYATTASIAPSYLPLAGGTIAGNLNIIGTASIAFLNVSFQSSSILFSSGSNQFGDASNDIQTLIGTVIVSSSQQITGSLNVLGSTQITGTLNASGSQTFQGTKTISGSVFITGSKTVVGNNYVSGAMDITGTFSLTGPSIQNAATLTSTLISGAMEYDGSTFYRTADANGRSLNANHHLYYQPTTIIHSVFAQQIDFFSGSNSGFNMLPNSLYELHYNLFYRKGASGTTIFTFTSNNTWQSANIQSERTAIAGTGTTGSSDITTSAGALFATVINSTGTSVSIGGGTQVDATNSFQRAVFKALFYTNAAAVNNLKLQVTSAGSALTVYQGSYYTIKKYPVSSVGIFTA
jgi:hypothetical protein